MSRSHLRQWVLTFALPLLGVATVAPAARSQTPAQDIIRVDLPIGRSYPIETATAITRVSVANPEVADVAVVGERDVVINARTTGETDVILWPTGAPRRHYRVLVHSAADRMQVLLGVKFAEVRRDALRELGVSGLYRDGNVRTGTGIFGNDNVFTDDGGIELPQTRFLTVLSDFGTEDFLAFIDLQAQRGQARILAEPNLMAANLEEATFLAGGEIPIPVAQPNQGGGGAVVTVQFREFGIRLNFRPEIVSDSLIKLRVVPEVSSLDFGNAVLLQGFRIPALRTRRISSTVDVKRNTSLVISGLFNQERETARTGIPYLMDIPILGNLFSSTRWLNNDSELVVIVTPILVDPNNPRPQSVAPVRPDTALPAREALQDRLTTPPRTGPPAQRRP